MHKNNNMSAQCKQFSSLMRVNGCSRGGLWLGSADRDAGGHAAAACSRFSHQVNFVNCLRFFNAIAAHSLFETNPAVEQGTFHNYAQPCRVRKAAPTERIASQPEVLALQHFQHDGFPTNRPSCAICPFRSTRATSQDSITPPSTCLLPPHLQRTDELARNLAGISTFRSGAARAGRMPLFRRSTIASSSRANASSRISMCGNRRS